MIGGEGTRLYGGRFVPTGVRAVYASLEEENALREGTIRKTALRGRGRIGVGEYPRMTYVLSVATNRNLDRASTIPPELANVVRLRLRGTGILPRRNWRPSGFQRVSTVSFFRLRQALAGMLRCISQTPVPVAWSFAIVPKYWPPSAGHVWASEVGKRFVAALQQSGPSSLRRRVPSRPSLRVPGCMVA